QSIRILMEGAPTGVDVADIVRRAKTADRVIDIHHVHFWQLDEQNCALEAHVVIDSDDSRQLESIKHEVKSILENEFQIRHSTLEFEFADATALSCRAGSFACGRT
ncbi:MAG: cation transporter, partial [Planctomycetota bacterium]